MHTSLRSVRITQQLGEGRRFATSHNNRLAASPKLPEGNFAKLLCYIQSASARRKKRLKNKINLMIMELIILGSGGIEGTPKPCCNCERCKIAKEKNGKYFRTGPSLFINSANVLIDTPEEIRYQLIKNNIKQVDAIFYTHWHPDHTMGLRIIEQINLDCRKNKPKNKPIDVHFPGDQLNLLDKFLIRKNVFDFYQSRGLMKLHLLKDRDEIIFGDIRTQAIQFPTSTAFYYLVREGNKKVIYMPCEIKKIEEIAELENADYLIIHFSWWDEENICNTAPWREEEVPIKRILEFAKNLKIKNIVFVHIDECHDKTYDELKELEEKYKEYNIRFAYDGMKIKL